MDIPILLMAWRRPDALRLVINAIRPLAPSNIYAACDGPNQSRSFEINQVACVREVFDNEIDWPCQVERYYSQTNQGCRLGISNAINWFFDHVEAGIILEDDCIPSSHFFDFCAAGLNNFRDNRDVMQISGNNFGASSKLFNGQPYSFSRFAQAWGWATWRDRWRYYSDVNDRLKYSIISQLIISNLRDLGFHRAFLKRSHYRDALLGAIDTWDYLWQAALIANNGLAVVPASNMISNIGFGSLSTHTIANSRRHCLGFDDSTVLDVSQKLMPSFNFALDIFMAKNMGMTYRAFGAYLFRSTLRSTLRSLSNDCA